MMGQCFKTQLVVVIIANFSLFQILNITQAVLFMLMLKVLLMII